MFLKKLVVLIFICLSFVNEAIHIHKDIHIKWTEYKEKYNLTFDGKEDQVRFKIFKKNYYLIQKSNSKNSGLYLEMNHFGHLKPNEFPSFIINRPSSEKNKINTTKKLSLNDIPQYVDWRKSGVVTDVENQLNCGSCYAFSAIGALESSFAIKTKKLIKLSKQEIVDCSTSDNYGCRGGYPYAVFKYAMKYGVSTEKAYKYIGKKNACRRNSSGARYFVKSYFDIDIGDENQLVEQLSIHGPISIALDARHVEFSFYKSGILEIPNCRTTYLNHAVLAVGYSLNQNPYLIVKNSWGTSWGENGYFRIRLFKNNSCGIASEASYPIPLVLT